MSTKLSVPRFRIAPSSPTAVDASKSSAASAGPTASDLGLPPESAPSPRPVVTVRRRAEPRPAPSDHDLIPPTDDGFGPEPFQTAMGDKPKAAAEPRKQSPEEAAQYEAELQALRSEDLTGRQLRLARRMAERHSINAPSDLEAVLLLRRAGLDPFARKTMLDLVSEAAANDANPAQTGEQGKGPPPEGPSGSGAIAAANNPNGNLPQVMPQPGLPGPVRSAQEHQISEIQKI